MLVFDERGKPEDPGKNLSEQSREPTNCVMQSANELLKVYTITKSFVLLLLFGMANSHLCDLVIEAKDNNNHY